MPEFGVMPMGIWSPARPSRGWWPPVVILVAATVGLLLLRGSNLESLVISSKNPLLWRRSFSLLSWDYLMWSRTSTASPASLAIVVMAMNQWMAADFQVADGGSLIWRRGFVCFSVSEVAVEADNKQRKGGDLDAVEGIGAQHRRWTQEGAGACCGGRRPVFLRELSILLVER